MLFAFDANSLSHQLQTYDFCMAFRVEELGRSPPLPVEFKLYHSRPPMLWRLFGDNSVTQESKSVHPVGNPMSHSTHVGFNVPDV